jgi:hypothetical protein
MVRIRRCCLVTFMLVGAQASALEPHQIFERVGPSVWLVREGGETSLGSAVVIAPGRLITNCHVVSRSKNIQVAKDNTSFDATIEYSDTQRDLCQLSVRNFFAPAVSMAPMQALKVGQRVYGIASPRGQELAISEGMVSSLRTTTDGSPSIQTTVSVPRGSSGGGLFDTDARLVGITSYVASEGPTTNFAQPADWIQDVPERGKPSLAARQGSAAGAPGGLYPRALAGEDLIHQFANLRRVEVKAPAALMSMSFSGGGNIVIRYFSSRTPSGNTNRGTYRVANDQVCFRLPPGTGASGSDYGGWDWMSDCFQVSQIDEKTYSLKNLKGDYVFSFAIP